MWAKRPWKAGQPVFTPHLLPVWGATRDMHGYQIIITVVVTDGNWKAGPHHYHNQHMRREPVCYPHQFPSAPHLGCWEDGAIIKGESYNMFDRKASCLKLTFSEGGDINHLCSLSGLKSLFTIGHARCDFSPLYCATLLLLPDTW